MPYTQLIFFVNGAPDGPDRSEMMGHQSCVRETAAEYEYSTQLFKTHIEAETKWPTFPRQYFQVHFLEWKCVNFGQNSTEVCF